MRASWHDARDRHKRRAAAVGKRHLRNFEDPWEAAQSAVAVTSWAFTI
jgi:hypothetical protein